MEHGLLPYYLRKHATYSLFHNFAKDIPGGTAGMNLGDSDVSLMLYRTTTAGDEFKEIQQLNVPGGEDAEFFTIDDRIFLATASMRSGSDPSYNMDVESCIFEWDGKKMNEFQCIPTFGAKQWRSFDIDGHHFLALAQGLVMPGIEPTLSMTNSTIFQWNGDKFESFQTVPSQMGYNWLHFSLDGRNFLAYADHIESSYILEWEDGQFVHFQTLDGANGRAFCFFQHNDRPFLAFARIASDSVVYKWDGKTFQQYQTLEGAGGREFTVIEEENAMFLVQVKFITGDTADPNTALTSVIYRVDDDGLKVATEFPTFGGTDVTTFSLQDGTYLVVTESLTEEIRFRQDSHIYRVALESAPANTNITTPAKNPAHSKRQDSAFVSPEFLSLFQVYTSVNNSIGYDFKQAMVETQASNPLLLATATDFILYPGNGADPTYLNHRFGTKGFIELTTVSHFSPAIATLVELRGLDPDSDTWKNHAKRLLNATQVAQKANSESLWKDKIGVKSYEGREANIAAMVDYSCEMTIRLLNAVLDDPTKLTAKWVRDNYLEATSDALNAAIPMNYVMVATFFLSGLDTAYRIQESFEQYDIDWANAMVLVDGQMERETAGAVIASNTIAQVLLRSFPDLPIERIYVAPHGPVPNVTDSSPDALREFEPILRGLWGQLNGTAKLGEKMFSGYPAYKVPENTFPAINSTTEFVSGFPAINGPEDWLALTTRLRVALEDIRQSVSASVTDYAAQQLYETGRNLSEIVVPGLDGHDYASAVAQGLA
ncbi:eptp domain containing [Fusarium albosuccineum]|uniref:Eptp domain containing n=1 Tax=Fusarium albosuccineum TaxID=1237068 RepID=A0A8H4LBQ7_9HYPO|nr:eptp domain containing [Fusarium albosuccineum]